FGDLPVTFEVRTFGGASAFFPDGTTTATVMSDAKTYAGLAVAPPLTANDTPGYFTIVASTPGASATELGPYINTAGTVTTLVQPTDYRRTTILGEPVVVVGRVEYTGYPGPGRPYNFPRPHGRTVMRVD